VKVESGKKTINDDVQILNIDGKSTKNLQAIVSAVNEYFVSLIEKIYVNNSNSGSTTATNNNSNRNNNNNNSILFFILYVLRQKPQSQLQTQHSVDKSS
jgi:hypothetical protein